jgi:hypothetical protein
VDDDILWKAFYVSENGIECQEEIKQPYRIGEILYVRETWSEWTDGYLYKAWTGPFPQAGQSAIMKWHPSIHMPKEAARIWLKVTDVRVERLHDITEEDAKAEGIYQSECRNCTGRFGCDVCLDEGHDEIDEFMNVWNSTIKKIDLDRYGWEANPYVFVIEFERYKKQEGDI